MALPFDTVSCARIGSDVRCSGCSWKCSCYECTGASSARQWAECQCPCRFWVVVCFVVLVGFFVVFYIATVFRRTLLYSMAAAAVAVAAALSALAAGTDECGWPAFFSISLVFAFPCLYSCCWQCQAHRRRARERDARDGNGAPGSIAASSDARAASVSFAKQGSTVVMVLPDGDVMLGFEDEDSTEHGDGGNKRSEKSKPGVQDAGGEASQENSEHAEENECSTRALMRA